MKNLFLTLFLFASSLGLSVGIGQTGPDFSLVGTDGKTWRLSDQRGKIVVLEWFNESCPYVKKHYSSGNMQQLQKEYTDKGVVWFTILSSAPGKQGYMTASELAKTLMNSQSKSTAGLLDPTGQVGKAYEAKTTPHLFILNEKGMLVYQGAIDDNSSSDPETIRGAKNYLKLALNAVLEKKSVAEASTKPYGCAVKYP